MFQNDEEQLFRNYAEGTWGQFSSAAGDVAFLMTKARLGKIGDDPERRLTAFLNPVREILETDALDFNQLLQRDLDDHRVATELIPYILGKKTSSPSPAFFPPIVAVMLPFVANRVENAFPNKSDYIKEKGAYGSTYSVSEYGKAFQVTQLWDTVKSVHHKIKLGRISWNDEEAKLVVIDGQHRAMALLAIERTLNKTWGTGNGTKYRYFYEHRVENLLKGIKGEDIEKKLEDLEFPVTICWFPDSPTPHLNARKLFVDLNKEARKPSEARLILMSDDEMINIFSRGLLNELRSGDGAMPVYAVEYDNPDSDRSQPVRWSVMTNLYLIKYSIIYSLFCPDRFCLDMSSKFGGKLPWEEMNAKMRRQLQLDTFLPEKIDDDGKIIDRSNIGNEYFPNKNSPEILKNFIGTWGQSLLILLSETKPYKDHCLALKELKEGWAVGNTVSSLAYEALFAGMGMYWTLKDSNEYFKQQVAESRSSGNPVPSKPDIVKAWEVIEDKRKEFDGLRANKYLNQTSDTAKAESNEAYNVFNTHACQLGAVLAFSTIVYTNGTKPEDLVEMASLVTKKWNAAFSTPHKGKKLTKLFSKNSPHPLNKIGKMDTPLAIYFRYFWLELLCYAPFTEEEVKLINLNVVKDKRNESRANYFQYLVLEQTKALKKVHSSWSETKVFEEATKEEKKSLATSLKYWVGIESTQFEEWYVDSITKNTKPNIVETETVESQNEQEETSEKDEVDEILESL
jgi:DNA-sulfur modification-associated